MGVTIFIYGEALSHEGVFNCEGGGVLREVILEHGGKDVAYELHDAVIKVRGICVLQHIICVGRS